MKKNDSSSDVVVIVLIPICETHATDNATASKSRIPNSNYRAGWDDIWGNTAGQDPSLAN